MLQALIQQASVFHGFNLCDIPMSNEQSQKKPAGHATGPRTHIEGMYPKTIIATPNVNNATYSTYWSFEP